ncbi:major facilitator superfamily domain-containing protein [Syncephalastrum racemosum]|uniref:Major facilitator superfamily domain-containing protein n=1 Tax=Syncephalastrum racemosum TaxID=13706 RepID=A0A1X2HK35_SYNRA|nr:major facilitator superfamily domain-containing protein [Syncephalastrum racemosum]
MHEESEEIKTLVHSTLFPLAPFMINRINHGTDDILTDASASDPAHSALSQATGIMIAFYAIGVLVGSPFFGWLGDRITQRRGPMVLGVLIAIAANVIFMVASAYWMLLVARFLQGISNSSVWTMALCLIADNWPEDQLGQQMGKLTSLYPLGMMTGLLTGAMYSKLSPQAPFIMAVILCAVDMCMILAIVERRQAPKAWFGEEEDKEHMTDDDSVETLAPTPPAQKVPVWQLLKSARLWTALYLTLTVAIAMSSSESATPLRLVSQWNFDEAAVGLSQIPFIILYIFSSVFSGCLCDRYGTKIVALLAALTLIPVTICMGLPDHTVSYWVIVGIFFICGGLLASLQTAIYPEIAGVVHQRNNAGSKDGMAMCYGFYNIAYGVGMSIGPLMSGYVYAAFGFFWLCVVLGAFYAGCLPLVFCFAGKSGKLVVRPQPPSSTPAKDEKALADSNV